MRKTLPGPGPARPGPDDDADWYRMRTLLGKKPLSAQDLGPDQPRDCGYVQYRGYRSAPEAIEVMVERLARFDPVVHHEDDQRASA